MWNFRICTCVFPKVHILEINNAQGKTKSFVFSYSLQCQDNGRKMTMLMQLTPIRETTHLLCPS